MLVQFPIVSGRVPLKALSKQMKTRMFCQLPTDAGIDPLIALRATSKEEILLLQLPKDSGITPVMLLLLQSKICTRGKTNE